MIVNQSAYLNSPAIIEAAFAVTLLGLGIGIFKNVAAMRLPHYETISNFNSRPLLSIFSVFFLSDAISGPICEIVLHNSVVHVLTLFCTGFYDEYRALEMDMLHLYSFALTIMLVGMVLFTSLVS